MPESRPIDRTDRSRLYFFFTPGVPTPNPALLVEITPPVSSAPVSLKWGGQNTNVRPPTNVVDQGLSASLKWNYPNGAPTPDPALLKGVPDQLVWGYPPGVPTPGMQERYMNDFVSKVHALNIAPFPTMQSHAIPRSHTARRWW
jgi:hypothetical protein